MSRLYEHADTATVLSLDTIFDLGSSGASSPIISADPNSRTLCVAVENLAHLGSICLNRSSPASPAFTWDQITVQSNITATALRQDILALAEQSGDIHVYFDVFNCLQRRRKPVETVINWHSSPVSALEFSRNGRYPVFVYLIV
jgi:hypothetical protein